MKPRDPMMVVCGVLASVKKQYNAGIKKSPYPHTQGAMNGQR